MNHREKFLFWSRWQNDKDHSNSSSLRKGEEVETKDLIEKEINWCDKKMISISILEIPPSQHIFGDNSRKGIEF